MVTPFVISRTFSAPAELLYKCWADPTEYGNWSGPKGTVVDVIRFDFRPGGQTHYRMTSGDNVSYGASAYIDIEPNVRLVWLNSFADEHGNAIKPPFTDVWPLYLHTTVTFTPQADGATNLEITWLPYEATAEEEAVFDGARDGMTQGWTGTLDTLTEYIAKLCQAA
jgi:uncharacterized protein YndB with AHSA1/START domain